MFVSDSQPQRRHAMILTAIPTEYQAIRTHLCEIEEIQHSRGTVYEQGRFICTDGDSWVVSMIETGPGNPEAAIEAERAMNFFNPGVLLFVGVAGGLKDVGLCDVVAATKVYGYESGKSAATFQPRPTVGESSYSMIQRARVEARKNTWLKRLDCSLYGAQPLVHVAPIAAGEKVVASRRSSVCKFIRGNYGDAVAVEMEGRGFLQAAYANQYINALIIRGISDLISGKTKADMAGYQTLAAQAASAFAFEIISNLDRQGHRESAHYFLLLSASINEADKRWVDSIVARLREISEDPTVTLLRIEPGSVKLLLSGSREGFERIETVFKSEKLSRVLGVEVIDLGRIGSSTPDKTIQQESRASTNLSVEKTHSSTSGEASTQVSDYEQLIGSRVGDYVIDELLGVGSVSSVYLAHSPQSQLRVAVKVFGLTERRSPSLETGLTEAKRQVGVHHNSVVGLLSPGISQIKFKGEGVRVLYIPIESRDSVDSQENPPFKNRRLSVWDFREMIGLLRGLREIHSRGIVHCDIKPANILQFREQFDGEDQTVLRITDFGLSRLLSALGEDRDEPSTGSPAFLAPEQFEHRVSTKSDIYGMGATFFYMITGRLPIEPVGANSRTMPDFLAWRESHRMVRRPNAMNYSAHCPPRLALLIMRMMSVDPDARPTLEECIAELERIVVTREQKILQRLAVPAKLKAELDRNEFPICYVPEDFKETFKPKVHTLAGQQFFVLRIKVQETAFVEYKRIIEYLVRLLSDTFSIYETWGEYSLIAFLWGGTGDGDNIRKALESRFGCDVEVLSATETTHLHCGVLDFPTDADPVLALAVQEGIDMSGPDRLSYLCDEFEEPITGIRAFTFIESSSQSVARFIRAAIANSVGRRLSEIYRLAASNSLSRRFPQISLIELSVEADPRILLVHAVASEHQYVSDIPTALLELGEHGIRTSTMLGTGRIVIQSDKILF